MSKLRKMENGVERNLNILCIFRQKTSKRDTFRKVNPKKHQISLLKYIDFPNIHFSNTLVVYSYSKILVILLNLLVNVGNDLSTFDYIFTCRLFSLLPALVEQVFFCCREKSVYTTNNSYERKRERRWTRVFYLHQRR